MSGGILCSRMTLLCYATGSKQKLADLGIRLGGASSSFYETTEGLAIANLRSLLLPMMTYE
jgi:hypothetical protein